MCAEALHRYSLRWTWPLPGVTCPACGHPAAELTVEVPCADEFAPERNETWTVEDPTIAFTYVTHMGDPIPVMMACGGCDRSVKFGSRPPKLEVVVADWLRP